MRNRWMTVVALSCAITMATPLIAADISNADSGEPEKERESETTVDHEHDDPGDPGLKFYEAIDVSERRENLIGIQ